MNVYGACVCVSVWYGGVDVWSVCLCLCGVCGGGCAFVCHIGMYAGHVCPCVCAGGVTRQASGGLGCNPSTSVSSAEKLRE